jgi:hypothetical protein
MSAKNDNVRTQVEICADLIDRAEKLENSARTAGHRKHNREILLVAARVLRVAALQNSPSYEGKRDNLMSEIVED